MSYRDDAKFSELQGKTLQGVKQLDDERIAFMTTDKDMYLLKYDHDCCAKCWIESIDGDLSDLIDTPILLAEQVSNADRPYLIDEDDDVDDPYIPDSYTWTFYKLRTMKGSVTIRYYGTSNGYYSEEATFCKVPYGT